MQSYRKAMIWTVIAAAGVLGTTLATGQSSDGVPTTLNNIFSRTKIVEIDNDVFRLGTSNGELFRFKGDLRGPTANGVFQSIVAPVNGANSGFLQIQRAGDGTFLVDTVNGTTWILRRKSANNGGWILVDTQ